jgi:hypothetical protein
MPLVNKSIASFIGGVSQQPASIRHPTQVERMENCVPSVAVGVRKRTGSTHVAKLTNVNHAGAFVHSINRGTSGSLERFIVVIDQGDLRVYNYEGVAQTVRFPNGKQYLNTYNPGSIARDIFKATTVADYTFITNTDRIVQPLPWRGESIYGPQPDVFGRPQPTFIVVKLAVPAGKYTVHLNGIDYSHTTVDKPKSTDDVVLPLASLISAGGQFSCEVIGNLIVATPLNGLEWYNYRVSDSAGDTAIIAFKDTVSRFEELPRKFVEDWVIKIKGDPGADNGWYVKWSKDSWAGDGNWVEWDLAGIVNQMERATMPHLLIREGDGTWTFKGASWDQRKVGDEESNPMPSFLWRTITDVFFFRNRLGFLSDENVVLSQAGNYFNFFAQTARAVLDSDPIDITASTTKVTLLKHAIAFDRTMLILSDKMQFIFASGETLTPKTAHLQPVTTFEVSKECPPCALGRNIYFAVKRGASTGVREYYVDTNSLANDAADITAHVPSYIPSGVYRLVSAASEDIIFGLTTKERNAIYVYNSYWNGDQKGQSAWHKWVFSPSDVITEVEVFESTLVLVIARSDGTYMERLELAERPESPAPYTICLDRQVMLVSGAYNATSKTTSWTLPFPDTGEFVAIPTTATGEIGTGLACNRPSNTTVSVAGNYAGMPVVFGRKYTKLIQLSRLFNRDPQNNAILDGRLQLRTMDIAYDRTGYFRAVVTPKARDPNTYVYTSKELGLSSMVVGKVNIAAGGFRFPLMAKSDEVTIELVNDSHLPSTFQSGEWVGEFVMQSKRS